ncbi:hypothetical protein HDV05_004077 [Chytridiales sp. JEL 0842]|nr:hypothetical protein HDV05_004077 [Chytridiales sp. JEL 0842]
MSRSATPAAASATSAASTAAKAPAKRSRRDSSLPASSSNKKNGSTTSNHQDTTTTKADDRVLQSRHNNKSSNNNNNNNYNNTNMSKNSSSNVGSKGKSMLLHVRVHQVASLNVLVADLTSSTNPHIFSTLRFRTMAMSTDSIQELLERVKEGFVNLVKQRAKANSISQAAAAEEVYINEDLELINFASVRDNMDSDILPPLKIGDVFQAGDIVHIVVVVPSTISTEVAEEAVDQDSQLNDQAAQEGEEQVQEPQPPGEKSTKTKKEKSNAKKRRRSQRGGSDIEENDNGELVAMDIDINQAPDKTPSSKRKKRKTSAEEEAVEPQTVTVEIMEISANDQAEKVTDEEMHVDAQQVFTKSKKEKRSKTRKSMNPTEVIPKKNEDDAPASPTSKNKSRKQKKHVCGSDATAEAKEEAPVEPVDETRSDKNGSKKERRKSQKLKQTDEIETTVRQPMDIVEAEADMPEQPIEQIAEKQSVEAVAESGEGIGKKKRRKSQKLKPADEVLETESPAVEEPGKNKRKSKKETIEPASPVIQPMDIFESSNSSNGESEEKRSKRKWRRAQKAQDFLEKAANNTDLILPDSLLSENDDDNGLMEDIDIVSHPNTPAKSSTAELDKSLIVEDSDEAPHVERSPSPSLSPSKRNRRRLLKEQSASPARSHVSELSQSPKRSQEAGDNDDETLKTSEHVGNLATVSTTVDDGGDETSSGEELSMSQDLSALTQARKSRVAESEIEDEVEQDVDEAIAQTVDAMAVESSHDDDDEGKLQNDENDKTSDSDNSDSETKQGTTATQKPLLKALSRANHASPAIKPANLPLSTLSRSNSFSSTTSFLPALASNTGTGGGRLSLSLQDLAKQFEMKPSTTTTSSSQFNTIGLSQTLVADPNEESSESDSNLHGLGVSNSSSDESSSDEEESASRPPKSRMAGGRSRKRRSALFQLAIDADGPSSRRDSINSQASAKSSKPLRRAIMSPLRPTPTPLTPQSISPARSVSGAAGNKGKPIALSSAVEEAIVDAARKTGSDVEYSDQES